MRIGKGTSTSVVHADAYIGALDLPGAQRIVPPAWRRLKTFDDIYRLSGVPVVTVQLRQALPHARALQLAGTMGEQFAACAAQMQQARAFDVPTSRGKSSCHFQMSSQADVCLDRPKRCAGTMAGSQRCRASSGGTRRPQQAWTTSCTLGMLVRPLSVSFLRRDVQAV